MVVGNAGHSPALSPERGVRFIFGFFLLLFCLFDFSNGFQEVWLDLRCNLCVRWGQEGAWPG